MKRKTILTAGISLFLFVYTAFFWKAGWLMGSVFTLIPAIVLIILLIINIFSSLKKRRHYTGYIIVSMISIFTGIISGLTIGEYEENEVIKRAGLMINSVKQYKQVTGKYPGKTDELVPEYIPSGYNFNKLKYEKRNEKYFRIIINTRNCGMIFESEDNRWHYRPCP